MSEPRSIGTTRVVITGIGLFTGLGAGTEASWSALRAGRVGIRTIDVPGFAPSDRLFGCPLGHSDHRMAMHVEEASIEAIEDARLREALDRLDRGRVATVVGVSKGDLGRLARLHDRLVVRGPAGTEESWERLWTRAWPNVGAVQAAQAWDFQGPSLAPIAACATGVVAVLRAAALIRDGTCDVALAGAADASLEPLVMGAFRRMRVLARVEGDPTLAMRPWDRARSGFLVGEGGAVLVLEREDHARARGVRPYAEVSGGAIGSDAYHLTDLDPDPSRLASLIREALERSGVEAGEIDYVNVHGTATRVNDPLECRAIRRALGPHADSVSCSANKAQIGHLLGGAGAAELAITCLAIRDQFSPPTLNLTDPAPACDLDGTPLVGRLRPIRAALKLSLGFGGHLAVAVLRRPDCPPRSRHRPESELPG